MSYGFVIRAMNLAVPAKILEIGCGTGALSIHLARMGYDLTAVDVNPIYAAHVAKLCEGAPGKVTTITADMNTLELPPDYDAVLFYESFHHSYDHPRTLARALGFLKPGGVLVLAAEPVVAAPCDILPYAWGPRLDGETLRAIRRFGWMEMGFTEGYLFELLRRNGLAFRRVTSPETHWADLIIATREAGAD
jgi:SAM-dependent methyltransferase